MNKIINKFLLTGDNFMQKLHLKQSRYTYSTCKLFNEHYKKNSKVWRISKSVSHSGL